MVSGRTHAEAAPLLQPDDDTVPEQRKCSLVREKSRANSGTLPVSVAAVGKCYLQDGGETASGKRVTKKLVLACSLAFAFMLFECVGGYFAHSVAILSDAAHMFSDVFSFIVSIYCMRLINMKASSAYSFGYHRAETIGALVSILIVCVITGGLVLEAVQRLINPTPIDGKIMFIVATAGIGFNILLLLTLGHDHHHHLGGSCGHDHGHDHGSSHGHSHGNCHGHEHSHGPDHDHSHEHSHGVEDEDAGCCSAGAVTSDDVHNRHTDGASAASKHSEFLDYEHGHEEDHNHGNDHGHDHACDHTKSSTGHGVDRVSVENLCNSAGGILHVQIEAADGDGSSDTVRLNTFPPSHSHEHHGCGHSHGHFHGDGGQGAEFQNQNLRGAIVHVVGDILQSVGVAAAGAIIWYTDGDPKWLWVDPVCTFMFAISVVWVTKTLIVDVTKDLMEAAPSDVDIEALTHQVNAVSGVTGIHDLHVWRIGTGKVILTAHIDVVDKSDPYLVIKYVEDVISAAGISHSTVQICSGQIEAAA